MLNYRTHIAKRSMFNTPPTWGIYIIALVMEWLETEGGLTAIEARNKAKAALLYNAIDNIDFYSCPVELESRSLMNVVFRVRGGDEVLEKKFVAESTAAGLVNLKGHRSVGGLRASLYNAQSMAGVQALVNFMAAFAKENG